jgi:ornithine cyclodeaminase/alanine dehydrogenase-like protein (mu-crystallin family)
VLKVSPGMLVLTAHELERLVTPASLIKAFEAAALAVAAGQAVVPPRLHMEWAPQRTLLAMPSAGFDAGQRIAAMGTKLVSVVPENRARGVPVTNGLMIVSEWETGLPIALLNAAALTAQRTGAVGALGIRHLTPEGIDRIGIIGCGVQGAWQAIFACAVRPVRKVLFLSRSAEAGALFEVAVRKHMQWFAPERAEYLEFERCQSARDLVVRADLIITATTSAEPVLPDDAQLLTAKHFVGIGSFRPDMQELPDSVYRLSGLLVIDSEAARHETGDVMGPVSRGVLKPEDIVPIGEVICGRRAIDTGRSTAFKSVGMALFDLYVAALFVEAARTRGIGQEVAL